MDFYSYLWLREDGTPYYAGKGTGKRAFVRGSHHLRPPKDKSLILIFPAATEAEAIASEIVMIDLFGRKDLGTGCLRNFTDGGDGVSGLQHTEDAKRRMSVGHKGRPSWNKGKPVTPEHSAALSQGQKNRTDSRNKGKHWKLSAETCQKMSDSQKGHFTSEETKQKIGQAHLGRKASDEARHNISEGHKNQVPWNKGKIGGSWTAARWAAFLSRPKRSAWNKGIKMPSVSAKMMGNTNRRKAPKEKNNG